MDIEQAIARRDAIVQAMQKLMRDGVDYGTIPGGDRPALLQPGADKLCNLFGIVIKYEFEVAEEDFTGERHNGAPFFYYRIRGRAFRGEHFMGEGIGSCNAWESKYRWRTAARTCPSCQKAAIIKGRAEYGGGWLCFRKKDGCGATFPDDDPAICTQPMGRVANEDLADVVNTVLKMAMKRCKVGTTINASSASELFTQDVEETLSASAISPISRCWRRSASRPPRRSARSSGWSTPITASHVGSQPHRFSSSRRRHSPGAGCAAGGHDSGGARRSGRGHQRARDPLPLLHAGPA
jgi:hypothetical protein